MRQNGVRSNVRFPYASRTKTSRGGKSLGYNDRLDESLGARDGAESTKSQSFKARRDESKGMEKAMGKRAYSSVSTMDKS